MNKCIFMGRLTADPQLKQTANGVAVCAFALAVDRPKQKDKDREADFFNMIAWRQKAEFIARWLHKGSKVLIDASARTRKYDKDGQTHYITEFVVNDVEFAENKTAQRGSGVGQNGKGKQNETEYNGFTDVDGDADDLPF